MNLSKPIQLITVGSLSLGALVLITLLVVQYLTEAELGLTAIIFAPLISAIISFVVFYF
jgi:hypothetical protein